MSLIGFIAAGERAMLPPWLPLHQAFAVAHPMDLLLQAHRWEDPKWGGSDIQRSWVAGACCPQRQQRERSCRLQSVCVLGRVFAWILYGGVFGRFLAGHGQNMGMRRRGTNSRKS